MPFSEKFLECVLAVDFSFIEALLIRGFFSHEGGMAAHLVTRTQYARGLQRIQGNCRRHLVLLTRKRNR